MRRLLLSFAIALIVAGPLSAGAAAARDQAGWDRGRGERAAPGGWGRHGEERRGPGWVQDPRGGWGRGPAPGYYGPPPVAYGPPHAYGVRRGGYLPPAVRGGVVGDYGRYRLRPPPRGYTWMRVGNALVLMNMATGQIFDVIED
jgi:Ni/Co efflux regulator RcnB